MNDDMKEELKDCYAKIDSLMRLHDDMADTIEELRQQNAELVTVLREVAEYEIEDGCPCTACEHSALARAALAKMEEGRD